MAANPILQAPPVDVPRHVWDAVNNAIHTSKIDGNVQPISLCYVAVRAALEESAHRELLEALKIARSAFRGRNEDGTYRGAGIGFTDDERDFIEAAIEKAEGL